MRNENQPEIRFQGFEEDWKQRKVGEFLKESKIKGSDGSIAKKLTVKLWRKGIILKEEAYQGSKATQYYVRKSGQFMYGKLDFLNQAFGIVPKELDGFESTLDSPAFDISNEMDSKFFLEFVSLSKFYKYQGNIANGSRKAKRIHAETFYEMPISLPSFEEQKRIGVLLEKIDESISLHQQELATLKQTKQGFLQKMFPKEGEKIPEVRFPEFNDRWELYKLGDLGSVAMNKRVFKDETHEKGEIPFYKIGTFGKKPDAFISRDLFEEYKVKYPYPEIGDLLLSASGSIGRVVEYKGKDEYFQDSNIVWLKHDKRILNSFLKQFYDIVKWEGLEGSTIKRLYNKNILETKIKIPTIDEQEKIGAFFKQLDDTIALHQRELKLLQLTKKAFLQKLFV